MKFDIEKMSTYTAEQLYQYLLPTIKKINKKYDYLTVDIDQKQYELLTYQAIK